VDAARGAEASLLASREAQMESSDLVDVSLDGLTAVVRGRRPGRTNLTLAVERPTADTLAEASARPRSPLATCTAVAAVEVSVGGFAVSCPSTSVLEGAVILCYALHVAAGELQPPDLRLLSAAAFEWSTTLSGDQEGSAHAKVETEADADAHAVPEASETGAAAAPPSVRLEPLPGSAFGVRLTALRAGRVELRVHVRLASGLTFASSASLGVHSPIAMQLPSILGSASPPFIVPPAARIPLATPAESRGASSIRFALCDTSEASASRGRDGDRAVAPSDTDGQGARLDGLELWTGARLGNVCVLATTRDAEGKHLEAQRLDFAVEAAAQLRWTYAIKSDGESVAGAVDFTGELRPSGETTVCAVVIDALGRRFVLDSLADGWLHLGGRDSSGASATAWLHELAVEVARDGPSCIRLTPRDEWLAAATGATSRGRHDASHALNESRRIEGSTTMRPGLAILAASAALPAASQSIAAHAYLPLTLRTSASEVAAAERSSPADRNVMNGEGSDGSYGAGLERVAASYLPGLEELEAGKGGREPSAAELIVATLLLGLAGYAIVDLRLHTRKPPLLNPKRDNQSLRGPQSPRHIPPPRTS